MKVPLFLMPVGFLILNSCTTSTILRPTLTMGTPSSTFTPTPTVTPSPSLTPTPSLEPLIDGWSTFYNSEFGFSFQYPALFDKGFQSFESTCDISIVENTPNKLFVVIGDILFNVEKTNLNLAEYTNYYIENNRPGWDVKRTPIDVHGLSANKLEYHQTLPPRYGVVTILEKENNALTVTHFENNFFYCDLKDDNHSSSWIYKRILQSLEFE